MRIKRILFPATIVLGLLASLIGMMVPIVQAEEGDTVIKFHVQYSENLDPIPEDSENEIVFDGEWISSTSDKLWIKVKNICVESNPTPTGTPTATPSPTPSPTPTTTPTGTPTPYNCSAQDIFYRVSLTVSWINGYYNDNNMYCCHYDDKNLAPFAEFGISGNANVVRTFFGRCGDEHVFSDSCAYMSTEGIIPAEDIENQSPGLDPQFHWDEEIYLNWDTDYSGLSVTTFYTITLSAEPFQDDEGCAGQYNIGAALGTFSLSSNNSQGANLQTILKTSYPKPGDWYVVKVTSGYWKNNGTGPDLRTLGIKNGIYGVWFPIISNPILGCADEDNDTYYLQMAFAGPTFLRVYDEDGNFAANTGTLGITIFGVTEFTPFPRDCELTYEVGPLLEQKTVEADWSNGWPLMRPFYLPWNPHALGSLGEEVAYTRYYMLETTGGPADLGTFQYTWDADLALRDAETDIHPDEWFEIQTAPFVTCAVQTDVVGHVRVYFALDKRVDVYEFIKYYYAFRVRDTGSYANNTGTLSYRLYQATNNQYTPPGDPPGPDGCIKFHHAATPTASIVIQGSDEDGTPMPPLISKSMYALEVVDGPWKDGGVDDYDVQISDNNGDTWVDLKDYPYLLCAASADGDHIIIYIYGAAGKTWRARADDVDTNFGNNTLSIGMDIYPAFANIDPWVGCKDNYTLTKVPLGDEQRKVPGNLEGGKSVPTIIKPNLYSIEITGESMWYEAGGSTGSYLVDISDDNGSTWVALEEYTDLCVVQIEGEQFQIYFASESNTYQLRARDGDDNFASNTGFVMFNLYKAQDTHDPWNPPPDKPPAEWVVACNEKYSRPNGFIGWLQIGPILGVTFNLPIPRVGEWLDYLRNAITFYFAWCPQHTESIASIGKVYLTKEPLASIKTLLEFARNMQILISTYQSQGAEDQVAGLVSMEPYLFSDTQYIGQTGGEGQYISPVYARPWDMFIIGSLDPDTNFWYGGRIDMSAGLGSSDLSAQAGYKTICIDKFYNLFGIATEPYCSFMSALRYINIVPYLLLGIDLMTVIWFALKYLPGYGRRFLNIITGNKKLVGKVIDKV